MTMSFYSQVEGVPGSRIIIFFVFNYPILLTYLFIYYSDVRFFLLSYIFYLHLFIDFIDFIYSDIVLFMFLSVLI